MGRLRGVEDAAPCNALLPFLLRFQFLFLGDILLQLALAPAVDLGLLGTLNAQRTGRHVMADGGAGRREGVVAHGHGSHQIRVAADEGVIADGGVELALAVIVAGHGAAAEVAVLAHGGIADVGQVADGVALGKVGILRLDIGTQMAALGSFGAGAQMAEGADLVVGADVAFIALAGVYGGASLDNGILQQGVGADDAVCADDGLAAQDAARQDRGAGGNDDLRLNIDIAADKVYAVVQMALKRGSVALLRQLKFFFCGSHSTSSFIYSCSAGRHPAVFYTSLLYITRRILASRKTPQGPNYAKNIVRRAHRRIPGPAGNKSRQIQKRFQTFFPL